jgi:hypothetical protein
MLKFKRVSLLVSFFFFQFIIIIIIIFFLLFLSSILMLIFFYKMTLMRRQQRPHFRIIKLLLREFTSIYLRATFFRFNFANNIEIIHIYIYIYVAVGNDSSFFQNESLHAYTKKNKNTSKKF